MWFRRVDGAVTNLETGSTFDVREVADARGVPSWEIVHYNPPRPGVVLQRGYASKDDADSALNDVVTAFDIEPVIVADPNAKEAEEEEGTEAVDDKGKGEAE